MHFKNATLYVGNCNKEQKLSYDNFCSLLHLLKCISIHTKYKNVQYMMKK